MSFLRIAAVVIGLGAVPVLFASAEDLSSRVRDAEAAPSGRPLTAAGPDAWPRLAESATPSRDRTFTDDGFRDRASAPTFGRIVITPGGASTFEGRSAPGAEVSLTIGAAPLGKTCADENGSWRLEVTTPLATGDHTISSASKGRDARREVIGQDVRIAIPAAFSSQAVVAYEATAEKPPAPAPVSPPPADSLRSRAEELAAAASQRFTDIAEKAKEREIAQTTPAPQPQPPAATAPSPRPPKAHAPSADKQPSPAGPSEGGRIAAPVFEWLERSAREYQETIIRGLSEPVAGGSGAVASQPKPAPTPSSPRTGDRTSTGDLITDAQLAVQEWLARANRTYQTEIMRKLEQPVSGAGMAATPPAPKTADKAGDKAADKAREQSAEKAKAERDRLAAAEAEDQKRRADAAQREEEERLRADAAKRAAEAADRAPPKPIEQVVPVAPPPKSDPAAADDARRKRVAEEDAAAKAAEAARLAEQKRLEAEAARVREAAERTKAEQQKAEQEARAALKAAEEAAKRRESDAKRVAEQKAAEAALKAGGQPKSAAKSSTRNEDDAPASALDLARKAVEQARTGPARRAAEQQAASEPGAGAAGSGSSGTQSRAQPGTPAARDGAADSRRAAMPRPRPKDDRIAEGSGETGPVDPPKPSRASGRAATVAADGGGPGTPGAAGAGRKVALPAARGRTCARAGREITPPGAYIVGEGDTLSEIAERHYGTWRRMWRIVKANRRALRDPDYIRICQRIWLP